MGVMNSGTQFSKARVETLCDGVFAIAMTLLVLELRVPDLPKPVVTADMWRALGSLRLGFFAYGLSFMLALASTKSRAPKSILDQTFSTPPVTAPAPPAGGANSAIPLTPAPNAAAPATTAPPTGNSATGAKKPVEQPPAKKP